MSAMNAAKKFDAWAIDLLSKIGGATVVHVGFLEGSTAGWNGPRPKKPGKKWKRTEKPSSSINNPPAAYIAWVMEYGDPGHNIPPRPFFSNMINEHSSSWPQLVSAAMRNTNYDSRKALHMIGLKVKEQLQLSIVDGDFAELKQATKDRKGFDTPLIDSHNMINSIDYVVT